MTFTAKCAIIPSGTAYEEPLAAAVERAGGVVASVGDADAVLWVDPRGKGNLATILAEQPSIRWVQLPYAGIEPFLDLIDDQRLWTCGKGVYAEPVAEHALGLALAGLRGSAHYARQSSWSTPVGRSLVGGRVTILGGGGIAECLTKLLKPFEATVTVVRNRPLPMDGVARVVGSADLHEALSDADVVVLALALTAQTRHIIDAPALRAMPHHSWLVNVARGGHVDTDALVAALTDGSIGGAALDVTDPEPLPDDHRLWSLPNALITPHVGNTPEMGRRLLARRVEENVRRFQNRQPLLGPVHRELGY